MQLMRMSEHGRQRNARRKQSRSALEHWMQSIGRELKDEKKDEPRNEEDMTKRIGMSLMRLDHYGSTTAMFGRKAQTAAKLASWTMRGRG